MAQGTRGAIRMLKRGGIAVMPTDMILGIIGSALRPRTVEGIYRVRGCDRRKPLIVLITSVRDLTRFGIKPSLRLDAFLKRVWPGPVSVVLACPGKKFRYLHRGTNAIAFRVPKSPSLRTLLAKTGPLVAPSANRAGEPPAKHVEEARRMFGNGIDVYVPGRSQSFTPSLVVKILR